jgi:type I restriction enzyme M protein
MANPPFNVDMVDAERIKTDRRLPFGLPGTTKGKSNKNGNGAKQNKSHGVQCQLFVDFIFLQLFK